MLEVNRSLHTLTLRSCDLSTALSNIAQALLTHNTTLTTLTLFGNHFPQDALGVFNEIKVNRIVPLLTDFEVYIVDDMYQLAEKGHNSDS